MADANEEKIKREMDEVLHGRSKAAQGPAGFKQNEYTKIHHVIGVISGKGGVGKSFVCGSLAVELARSGARVGILDADITGPSIPKMLGLAGERATAVNDILVPATTKGGIEVMSANLVLENETDPIVWRGPVIAGALRQFFEECAWGELDYLLVDMPPGTGDVPLTVFQSLPIDGIVIVTSPQELVSMIVRKAVKMADNMGVPVLGLVENYSYFECPNCHEQHKLFGESHVDEVAEQYHIDLVAKIPIDPAIAAAVDKGQVEDVDSPQIDEFVTKLGEKVATLPKRKSPFLIAQERQAAELDARLDAAGIPKIDKSKQE